MHTGRGGQPWLGLTLWLRKKRNYWLFSAILVLLPLLVSLVCLTIGRYPMTIADVFTTIWQNIKGTAVLDDQLTKIVWTIRLPRLLLAMMVGAGLSAAGTAFQSLFANPLATPDTLGVASGASFGAVLALYFGLPLIPVQLLALLFGFIAVGLTWLSSWRRESGSLIAVVLAGIVVGSLFTALISLVKYVADTESQLPAITYWLMGSLAATGYRTLLLGAPFVLVGCGILFFIRWRLNILPLSDDEARATGTNLGLLRGLTVFAATLITASCVSMCGQVGWVGLLVPHICRMAFGSDTRILIPTSLSLGAVFLVIMDTLARSMTAAELPISVLTALIGAPFFVWLLRRTGGGTL